MAEFLPVENSIEKTLLPQFDSDCGIKDDVESSLILIFVVMVEPQIFCQEAGVPDSRCMVKSK